MDRAYAILTVKAVEEDRRIVRGIATTPSTDRMGDIVEPLGIVFRNPMPLLHQHDHSRPVGMVRFDKPTAEGITFEASLPQIADPGPLKDRVDTAWGEVKAGLVRAVSIGFRPLESSRMEDGGYRYLRSEVVELSLVTIPANADATITFVRSVDRGLLAASGPTQPSTVRHSTPGASGSHHTADPQKGARTVTKTIAEQISAFEATRQAKAARMTDLMNKAADEGVTLDAAQTEEYDGLEAEVKSIDGHLTRLSALEKANKAAAVPVQGVTDPTSGTAARGGVRVEVRNAQLPKGTAFTRYVMALANAKGNLMQAAEVAKRWHDSTPQVETVLRAAVAAGTTTGTTWAAPLVDYQTMTSEFAELLRPATIVGRIPNLRRVPFKVKIPRQTAGSTAAWVGEGLAKPVSSLAFDSITMEQTKIAGIVVLTDELVRLSNPAAEDLVRTDMVNAIAALMDKDFVDPGKVAVAGVSPASITNGAPRVIASGTTTDNLRADVKALMAGFIADNLSLSGAVWIMSEQLALSISIMQNALGQPDFPGMNVNGNQGGTFFGLPVILSENGTANAAETGPPVVAAGSLLILAKASEILLADDGQTEIDVSREASLQMDSAPTSPPSATTVFRSLWQDNLVGIRAERYINWAKRRPNIVRYIVGANYVG